MAARKKTTSRGAKASAGSARGRKTAAVAKADPWLVILEQMHEQNRATVEAVTASEQRLRRDMEVTDHKYDLRFQSLEAAMRINSDLLRETNKEVRKNSEDIRKNSEDIQHLSERVDKQAEDIRHLASQVGELVGRVERLESLVGLKADARQVADLDARVRRIEEHVGLPPPSAP